MTGYINIDKRTSLDIINFCFHSNYFPYNNIIYLQINGSAMGTSHILSFEPHFIKIYVDDMISAILEGNESVLSQLFNSYHENI